MGIRWPRLLGDQRGTVAVIGALGLTVFLGIAFLALDLSHRGLLTDISWTPFADGSDERSVPGNPGLITLACL